MLLTIGKGLKEPFCFGSGNNPRSIIKLHGSFPLDHLRTGSNPDNSHFRNWISYPDSFESLVLGSRSYSSSPEAQKSIKDLINDVSSNGFGVTISAIKIMFIMGYGMGSEDHLVSTFLNALKNRSRIAVTFGGDEVETFSIYRKDPKSEYCIN